MHCLRPTATAQRGEAQFEPISWKRAFDILARRLEEIRATDPKKLALFTGRDQMQALPAFLRAKSARPGVDQTPGKDI